jgi:hypothetical protein
MTTSSHQLAKDVFMCLADRRFVFLDLRQNRYLCLDRRNTEIATRLFADSTAPHPKLLMKKCALDSEDTRPIVQALIGRGLLVQHGLNGNVATSVCIQTAENILLPKGSGTKPVIRHGHWTAFLHASLSASWKLRWHSMQRIVRAVEDRKQRCVKSQTMDHDPLAELVATFHQLRPFYVRKYVCLYDSLALVEFLAHYRLFPQWVFGVTAEPFAAHCWVQQGDRVLNDSVEYVRGFTPIMVV